MLSQIESILFVASKPLSVKTIAKALGADAAEVKDTIEQLRAKYNRKDSGIHLFVDGDPSAGSGQVTVQLGTNPENAEAIEGFITEEATGELTKPQLETLTVVAYRSPITRPELEQIRGVNCAIILRNLLMRGLIEEKEDAEKLLTVYTVSFEALRHLGITSVRELPGYEALHMHEHVEAAIR